jgi:hypothetical protein
MASPVPVFNSSLSEQIFIKYMQGRREIVETRAAACLAH